MKILKILAWSCVAILGLATIRAWWLAVACLLQHMWGFGSVLAVIGVWGLCSFLWALRSVLEDKE